MFSGTINSQGERYINLESLATTFWGSMSKKENRLEREMRYCLRRCKLLNHCEYRLLSFIATFEYGCFLTYDKIADDNQMSERTVRRTIASLKNLGLIEIEYRAYKKTKIQLVEASIQKEFSDRPATHGLSVTGHIQHTDRPPMAASPATHGLTNTERDLERKLERSFQHPQKENQNVDNSVDMVKIHDLIKKAFPKHRIKNT